MISRSAAMPGMLRGLVAIAVCVFVAISFAVPSFAQNKAPYDFTVSWINAQGQGVEGARSAAAACSYDGVALVVYGGDRRVLKAANRAVKEREKDANKDPRALPTGLVVADPPYPAVPEAVFVEVYIWGVRYPSAIIASGDEPERILPDKERKFRTYSSSIFGALRRWYDIRQSGGFPPSGVKLSQADKNRLCRANWNVSR